MLEIIVGTAVAFFTIVGIVEVSRGVMERLLLPNGEKMIFLIASSGHSESMEYRVRSLVYLAREMHLKSLPSIVIVDEGMDNETRKICELLASEFECVGICGNGELSSLISANT
ncbi:MAG TPA: hypothetical protein VHR42_07275 [Clostridia bacterium]|nr:hypothetical protein [Clostridia bacterium]